MDISQGIQTLHSQFCRSCGSWVNTYTITASIMPIFSATTTYSTHERFLILIKSRYAYMRVFIKRIIYTKYELFKYQNFK